MDKCVKCGGDCYASFNMVECGTPGCENFSFSFSEESGGFAAKAKAAAGRLATIKGPCVIRPPDSSMFPLTPGKAWSRYDLYHQCYSWCTNADKNWRNSDTYEFACLFGVVEGPENGRYPGGVGLYFPTKQLYHDWSDYKSQKRSRKP